MKAPLPAILLPVLAGAAFWASTRFARADEHAPATPPPPIAIAPAAQAIAAPRQPNHKPITRESAIVIALAFLEAQADAQYYTWHPGTAKAAFQKDRQRWRVTLSGDPSPVAQRIAAKKPWSGLPALYTTDIEILPDGQIPDEKFLCIKGW